MKKQNQFTTPIDYGKSYEGKRVISDKYGSGTIKYAWGGHFSIFEVLFDDGNYVKDLLCPDFTYIERENE